MSSPKRRPARKSQRDNGSRTARLEQRVDELVSALRAEKKTNIPPSPGLPTPLSNDGGDVPDIWTAAGISIAEAQRVLDVFMARNLDWLPFVFLPDTDVSRLYAHRPILWLGIMATCAKTQPEVHRLGNIFRQTIAQKMVVKAEKSIDLLLGMLVFIGW